MHHRVLAAAFDAVVLLDLETGEALQSFPTEPDHLASVALSQDGQTMLVGQKGYVSLRSVATGEELRRFEVQADESGQPIRMMYSPDDRIVFAVFEDGTMRAWEIETGRPLWDEVRIPQNMLWSVAFSQDGRTAVSADEDRSVVLWNLQSGQQIQRFEGHLDAVYDVALSADGTRLITASADRRVILWDVATGQPLHHFEGHSLPVRTVAFGPDGNTVLSGSEDRTVRLWDIETGAELFRFEGHSTTVQDVLAIPGDAQRPETWRILSRDVRGGHILWQLPPASVDELVAWTDANRYVRDLTCDERRVYNVPPLCAAN
jgi:WD40 repeat protein